MNEHLFIKVTVYFPFSLILEKNLNNARYSIHGNLLPVFSTDGSPLDLRRNKTTSSSKSTNPFSAARKAFYYASVNSSCPQPPPPPPPPPPPTPGYCRAFARLVSPRGGAFANFGLPGGRAFANHGANPEFLTRTRFPIRI